MASPLQSMMQNLTLPTWLEGVFDVFKPKNAVTLYNNALEQYDQHQYERALALLLKADQLQPEWAPLAYNMGLCYEKLNQPDAARRAYQVALKSAPEDLDCLYNLSRLLYEQNELESALAYAELADSVANEQCGDAMVTFLLGLIYEAKHDLDQAMQAYQQCLVMDPTNYEASLYLGRIHVGRQEFEQAIGIFERLSLSHPEEVDLLYELSQCNAKLNDWEKSIHYSQKVIALQPEYTTAYNQLGLAFYCTGQLEEAINNYLKAISLDPNYATAINNLAYAYERKGDLKRAIDQFSRYLDYTLERPAEKAEIEEHITHLQQKLATGA